MDKIAENKYQCIRLSKYSYQKFLFSLSPIVIHGQLKHL